MISGAEISPDSSQIDGHYVKVCHSVGPSALFLALYGGSDGGHRRRRRVLLDARSRTRLFCIFIFNARALIHARFMRFNGMLFGQLSDYSACATHARRFSLSLSLSSCVDAPRETLN
jgi:hypothetical protein